MSMPLQKITILVSRFLIWVYSGLDVEYGADIPRSGGLLIVSNHRSLADPPVIAITIPRPVRFMAKTDIFVNPVVNWFLNGVGAFPIRQGGVDRKGIRFAESLLEKGEAVCIFPEGRLTESGDMLTMNAGAVMIALHTGTPVLHIGLSGTDAMVPYGALKPQRAWRNIQVRTGGLITPMELSGGFHGRQALQYGAQLISQKIAELSEPGN
jgi:1-acyl-sn-glycerol-3-phosphate acyltransferase